METKRINPTFTQAIEFAGGIPQLARETGVKRRTMYYRASVGFLNYEQAKLVADRYGLDIAKLQERV